MKEHLIVSGARIQSMRSLISHNSFQLLQKQQKTDVDKSPLDKLMKNTIKQLTIKKIIRQFCNRLQRNSIYKKPINYKDPLQEYKDSKIKQKHKICGVRMNYTIKNLVRVFYGIAVFLLFFISTFQGFTTQFSSTASKSEIIIILKIYSIAAISLYLMMLLVSTQGIGGKNIKYLTQIFKINAKSIRFYIIILTLITSILFLTLSTNQTIGIVMFFINLANLPYANQGFKNLANYYLESVLARLIYQLLDLVTIIITFAHFITTLLLAISYIGTQNTGWLATKSLIESHWYTIYVYAYYWAVNIMLTVGFGDFSATTWQQAISVSVIQLFSVMSLAYMISQVSSIVKRLRQQQITIQDNLTLFYKMKSDSNIPEQLGYQIQSYFIQSVKINNDKSFQQQKIFIMSLPQNLRTQYLALVNKQIFKNLPLFGSLNIKTHAELAILLQSKYYYTGDRIFQRYDKQANDQIIMLKNGQVSLRYNRYKSQINNTIIQKLNINKNQSSFILNCQFLQLGKQYLYDIVAQNNSLCYQLSYSNFYQVLNNNQIQKQFYFTILHRNPLFSIKVWSKNCQYCFKQYHSLFQCPKLHYIPTKQVIITKSYKKLNIKQIRSNYIDRRRSNQYIKFSSSLKNHHELFQKLQKKWKLPVSSKPLLNHTLQGKISKSFDKIIHKLELSLDESLKTQQFTKQFQNIYYQIFLRALHDHFCSNKSMSQQQFQIDQSFNFVAYLPQQNPSRLISKSLKLKQSINFQEKEQLQQSKPLRQLFSSYI